MGHHILQKNKLLNFVPSSRPKRGKAVLNSRGKAYFSLEGKDQLPSFVKYAAFEAVTRIIVELLEEIGARKDDETLLNKIGKLSEQFMEMFREAIFSAEWIDTDEFLLKCWDLAQTLFPGKLLGSGEVSQLWEREDYLCKKDPLKTIITKYAFQRLAFTFDYYFLFPFNWYFGLAECVWTIKDHFAADLFTYLSLAKNLSPKPVFYSQERQEFNTFCNTFFRPCTSFKFTESISELV